MKTKQQTLQNLRSGLQSLLSPEKLQAFLDDAFGDDLHAARVSALNTSLRGVLKAGELSIHAIGRAIASIEGISRESGTNQIESLMYQGQICYDQLPNMREDRLKLLMRAFDKILRKEAFFKAVYGLT